MPANENYPLPHKQTPPRRVVGQLYLHLHVTRFGVTELDALYINYTIECPI
jgi:hypothetical protein